MSSVVYRLAHMDPDHGGYRQSHLDKYEDQFDFFKKLKKAYEDYKEGMSTGNYDKTTELPDIINYSTTWSVTPQGSHFWDVGWKKLSFDELLIEFNRCITLDDVLRPLEWE